MRELALHILDLVQNSAAAAATRVVLEIVEDRAADCLVIKVADNGCGMDEETRNRALDPFFTARKTRRVGLGLPLVAMSAAQCDGYLRILSRKGKGTVVKVCWRYSHLDRPPLGNIVATVQVLVLANPYLDFVYRHKAAGKVVSLTSRDINEAWPGFSPTSPAVISWLQEYLSSQYHRAKI